MTVEKFVRCILRILLPLKTPSPESYFKGGFGLAFPKAALCYGVPVTDS